MAEERMLMTMSATGITLSVRKPHDGDDPFVSRKPRKPVRAFSKTSQGSLKALWRRINWAPYLSSSPQEPQGRGLFVTLTLPQDQDPSREAFKRLKDRTRDRVLRQFGEGLEGVIWKSERQKETGTPHLHLVMLFAEHQDVVAVRIWFRNTWPFLVGYHSPEFVRHSIDVCATYGPQLPAEAAHRRRSGLGARQGMGHMGHRPTTHAGSGSL